MRFSEKPTVQPVNESWEQIILRSSAQKKAGIKGGEGMQLIFGISFAPSNPEFVYLVVDQSQVWKSINGGNSWHMKHKGFLPFGGMALSIDPVNKNIVFVAGSAHLLSRSSPVDGIYRTNDGGENWILLKSTHFFRGWEGEHFAFDLRSSENSKTMVIYAGTHEDGLMVSKDGGDNWKVIAFKGERILDIEIDPADQSVIYVLTSKGLFRATTENYNVLQIENIGENLQGPFTTFALNTKDPSIIYIAAGKKGVYKSTDRGKSFFRLKNGLPIGLDYSRVVINPANPDFIYVSVHKFGGLNPYWSHDGGSSWFKPKTLDKNNDSPFKGRYFSSHISPHPYKADIAITSAAGKILKTVDGGVTWAYSGNGNTGGRKGVGSTSQTFFQDPLKMIFFLLDFGPALTVDGGDTFRLLNVPRVFDRKSTPVGAVSPFPDEKLIVTAIGRPWKQKLAVSRNGGEKWKIIPETEDKYKFIAFHPQKANVIYAQGFISKDNGNSWKPLLKKVYAMFKGNGDIVYSVDHLGENKSAIRRSNDQGQNWITPYPYLPIKARSIYEIAIDSKDPDRIYVASQSGLYVYNDETRVWREKGEESGLSKDRFGKEAIRCVVVDPKHPEVVYAGRWAPGLGHSNGVFRSTDYGKTWMNITNNLGPEFTAWSISVSPHDGVVYVGSSHGTWTLPPPYNPR